MVGGEGVHGSRELSLRVSNDQAKVCCQGAVSCTSPLMSQLGELAQKYDLRIQVNNEGRWLEGEGGAWI